MKKKNRITILFIASIIVLLYFIITFGLLFYDEDKFHYVYNLLFKNIIGQIIYFYSSILTFIFGIYCLRMAIKEKDSLNIILLLFFNGFYLPIYHLLKIFKVKKYELQ